MSDELPVSPFAPQAFPPLPPIAGMHVFAAQTGVKYTGRPDFLLAEFSEPPASPAFLQNPKCRRHRSICRAKIWRRAAGAFAGWASMPAMPMPLQVPPARARQAAQPRHWQNACAQKRGKYFSPQPA